MADMTTKIIFNSAKDTKKDNVCAKPANAIDSKKSIPDLAVLSQMPLASMRKFHLKDFKYYNCSYVPYLGLTHSDGKTDGCGLGSCT
jgi:hypothetical protein